MKIAILSILCSLRSLPQFSCSREEGVKVYVNDVPYNCSKAGEEVRRELEQWRGRKRRGEEGGEEGEMGGREKFCPRAI